MGDSGKIRTTLAARAAISKSEETRLRVILRQERRKGERREMSRRHSMASARRMARVMRRDLHGVSGRRVERRMLTLVRVGFRREPLCTLIWCAFRALRRVCVSCPDGSLHSTRGARAPGHSDDTRGPRRAARTRKDSRPRRAPRDWE